ncbi:MAG: YCF48-related protein, partial [Ignavibacteriae bacterium]|nr:YCF48-related protein [Ignavibacteriota bacterium]
MKKFYLVKNKLIAILIFLYLLSGMDSYSQQHWRIISKPTNRNLWRCSFADTLNGWAIGDSGTILRTSNGGYNWVSQNSKLNVYMVSVFFLNKRLGWALGWGLEQNFYGTYMLKTTNGGIVWDTARYPVNDVYIRDLIFLDSLTGYM